MFDTNPLAPYDREFLTNVANLFLGAKPAGNRDGFVVIGIPTGDEKLIAEKLHRIAETGDSGAEVGRIVV